MQPVQEINWPLIRQIKTHGAKMEAAERLLKTLEYVDLSEIILHYSEGGNLFLELLDKEDREGMIDPSTGYTNRAMRRTWKLQVLRDTWGNPPIPGELVKLERRKRVRDAGGRKITNIKDLIRQGKRHLVYDTFAFAIDNKGCIECTYNDAGTLLMNHGVYYKAGTAITRHREMSREPMKAPDGQMRHVWYWLYQECPPWIYEQLPIIGNAETTNKRGRPPRSNAVGDMASA